MIKKLYKHKLDFDTTWVYLKDNLNGTNELSSQLLNLVNFKNGYFYTLLPSDANLAGLYDFKGGGILPQYPDVEYFVSGIRSTYSLIPCIDEELSRLILKEIKLKSNFTCLFDCVLSSPTDSYYTEFSDSYSLFYNKEVYLYLNQNNISLDLIEECLRSSNAFWHSLCVFTSADLEGIVKNIEKEKNLNRDNLKAICLSTKVIMVGAYDSEGYVFWEENVIGSEKEFFIS